MSKLKAIIIDDELMAIDTLKSLLNEYVTIVEVIGEAQSVPAAQIELNEKMKQVDLVFLDIKIGEDNGLELLSMIQNSSIKVVVTSAFSSYGLEAAKKGVFGYLEKPIDLKELTTICVKAQNYRSEKGVVTSQKLLIPTQRTVETLNIEDIEVLVADNNYTQIHLTSGSRITASKNLKHFEDRLPKELFFRVHKSYIVNITHVVRFSKGSLGAVTMRCGLKAMLSKYRKEDFVAFLDRF